MEAKRSVFKRVGTAVAALALGGGGLATVALAVTASPAEAATTAPVTTNVVSGSLLGWTQQSVTTQVDVPPTVTQGADFPMVVTPQPTQVPTTDGSGITVNYISNITTIVPVSSAVTVVQAPPAAGLSASYSGGPSSNPSGTVPLTVTYCTANNGTTCTATPNNTSAAYNSTSPPPFGAPTLPSAADPGYIEVQTGATQVPGGATLTFPSMTTELKASGAVGAVVTAQLNEFDTTANVTVTGFGTLNAVVTAWPTGTAPLPSSDLSSSSPMPAYAAVPLASTTIVAGPAVFSISPNTGSLAGGSSVTITGSGFTGATAVDFGSTPATSFTVDSDTQITAVAPAGAVGTSADVTVTSPKGTSATWSGDQFSWVKGAIGYHLVASDGGIFSFGGSQFHGSMGGKPLNAPVVGMAAVPNGGGYWEVAADGGIFSFGSAQFYGSMGGKPLNKPIVGMASTPHGHGYWEVASDGGIFSFGSAQFYGSMGGKPLNAPIVGMAATPDGGGYWEVASDGGIFTFGDAGFYGSMGGKPLNEPVVGMATTPSGAGYWEVASDGGIFTFGNASFFGSMGGKPLNAPVVGMAAVPDGGGYWEVASDGGIFTFGDANFYGSMGGKPLNKPMVGMGLTLSS